MPTLYNYTDYRAFLKDRFAALKAANPRFSYRSFNRIAGISSSGFLKLVMDGKRNLASDGLRRVAKGLKLNVAETAYFESLVLFSQAETAEEKDRHFRAMAKNKRFLTARPLVAARYRLFTHWYYAAILELLRMDAKTLQTPEAIHERLQPEVPLEEVRKAIEALKEMELVSENEAGRLEATETVLATEDEVESLVVANYHKQMSQLAAEAVMKSKAPDREFAALTVCTTPANFAIVKKEIQKLAKRLHLLLEQDSSRSKGVVAQINLQLFKLSKGSS